MRLGVTQTCPASNSSQLGVCDKDSTFWSWTLTRQTRTKREISFYPPKAARGASGEQRAAALIRLASWRARSKRRAFIKIHQACFPWDLGQTQFALPFPMNVKRLLMQIWLLLLHQTKLIVVWIKIWNEFSRKGRQSSKHWFHHML